MRKLKIIILFIVFEIIFIPALSILLVYYGPFKNTKEMIVTTAMTTMTHQYFATWFLSDAEIQQILAKNRPTEVIEEQAVADIKVDENVTDGIELIDVSSKTFKGYLLDIDDPSRVKLAPSPRMELIESTQNWMVSSNASI